MSCASYCARLPVFIGERPFGARPWLIQADEYSVSMFSTERGAFFCIGYEIEGPDCILVQDTGHNALPFAMRPRRQDGDEIAPLTWTATSEF